MKKSKSIVRPTRTTTNVRSKPFLASERLIHLLESVGQVQTVESGTVLFQTGDPARGIYLVRSGKFALWSGDDPVRITRIAETGCLLGLPATIRHQPYSLAAEAVSDASVYLVSAERFAELLHENPDAGLEVLEMLAEEISELRKLAVYQA